MPHRLPATILGIIIAAFVLIPLSALSRAQEKDKNSAGIVFDAKAGARDVGLPIYPASRPHKDKTNDSPSVNMGLWGRGSGFKLAVMKMESDDSSEKVAAFYRKALAKYGKVLDCSNAQPASSDADNEDSPLAHCPIHFATVPSPHTLRCSGLTRFHGVSPFAEMMVCH
jgi:hypothetical protein